MIGKFLEPVEWIFHEFTYTATNQQIKGNCYAIQFLYTSTTGGPFNDYVLINNTYKVYQVEGGSTTTFFTIPLQLQPGQLDQTIYNFKWPPGNKGILYVLRLVPKLFVKLQNIME